MTDYFFKFNWAWTSKLHQWALIYLFNASTVLSSTTCISLRAEESLSFWYISMRNEIVGHLHYFLCFSSGLSIKNENTRNCIKGMIRMLRLELRGFAVLLEILTLCHTIAHHIALFGYKTGFGTKAPVTNLVRAKTQDDTSELADAMKQTPKSKSKLNLKKGIEKEE